MLAGRRALGPVGELLGAARVLCQGPLGALIGRAGALLRSVRSWRVGPCTRRTGLFAGSHDAEVVGSVAGRWPMGYSPAAWFWGFWE